ncbi:MAG: hypothetical protein WDO13_09245 [Verrucomicrobiota bacterium]
MIMAYVSTAVTDAPWFSMSANLFLSATGAALLLRRGWTGVAFVSLPAPTSRCCAS